MQFTNSRQAAAVSPVRCGAGLGKQKCLFLLGKSDVRSVCTRNRKSCKNGAFRRGPDAAEMGVSASVTHMKPRTSGSQSTSAGKKTMATRPRPMNRSSQMTQRTVDSMDAPVSRQLTMRLTAMGGQNCPRAMT